MLLACMISLGFYEVNTVAKGEIIQCNEQSVHSRGHIISIKSKIRFWAINFHCLITWHGLCSPEVWTVVITQAQ